MDNLSIVEGSLYHSYFYIYMYIALFSVSFAADLPLYNTEEEKGQSKLTNQNNIRLKYPYPLLVHLQINESITLMMGANSVG